MLLTLKDRIVLLGILPPKGDLLTLRLVADLQMKLAASEDDYKNLDIKMEVVNGQSVTRWDGKKDTGAEIDLGDKGFKMCLDAFDALEKKKELTLEQLPTYEKLLAVITNV